MKKLKSKPQGQSLVEFSLLLIVLVIIFMLVMDLGRAMYIYSAITNAAREGARYAIANQPSSSYPLGSILSDSEDVAEEYAIGVDGVSATATALEYDALSEYYLYTSVMVTANYVPVTPLIGDLLGSGSISLSSESKMKNEY